MVSGTSTMKSTRRPPPLLAVIQAVSGMLGTISPSAASALLARVFTTPRRQKLSSEEKKWLTAAAARPIRLKSGAEIPLYEWRAVPRGFGVLDEAPLPTVLLVHGMSGRAAQLGGFAAPLVAAGFRVVAFDAPGHGAAAGRRSSLPEMLWVTEEVAAKLGPLDGIVAHSNGAAATIAALGRGMRVKRVALLAPPTDLERYLGKVARLLGFGDRVARGAQHRLERRYGVPFSALKGTDLAPGLSQPALIVHDNGDRIVPASEGRALADNWPGAKLHVTAGLGHGHILRDEAVISRVVEHLAPQRKAPAR
ncbi:MAG: alpha/beta fold hydrolase [Rhodobacteraceae bacterium]|nr:alpha/beta fold hydrolase [Paracoccaceae bacterium]